MPHRSGGQRARCRRRRGNRPHVLRCCPLHRRQRPVPWRHGHRPRAGGRAGRLARRRRRRLRGRRRGRCARCLIVAVAAADSDHCRLLGRLLLVPLRRQPAASAALHQHPGASNNTSTQQPPPRSQGQERSSCKWHRTPPPPSPCPPDGALRCKLRLDCCCRRLLPLPLPLLPLPLLQVLMPQYLIQKCVLVGGQRLDTLCKCKQAGKRARTQAGWQAGKAPAWSPCPWSLCCGWAAPPPLHPPCPPAVAAAARSCREKGSRAGPQSIRRQAGGAAAHQKTGGRGKQMGPRSCHPACNDLPSLQACSPQPRSHTATHRSSGCAKSSKSSWLRSM